MGQGFPVKSISALRESLPRQLGDMTLLLSLINIDTNTKAED
jgi:hypothetical protein